MFNSNTFKFWQKKEKYTLKKVSFFRLFNEKITQVSAQKFFAKLDVSPDFSDLQIEFNWKNSISNIEINVLLQDVLFCFLCLI